MQSYNTPDSCLDGNTRKRQTAIDMVRMATRLAEIIEEAGIDQDQEDIRELIIEATSMMPKADREELRHG